MKRWWQSRTIWGAVAVLIAELARAFGLEVSEEEVGGLLMQIVTVAGALVAIYGRVQATARIRSAAAPKV